MAILRNLVCARPPVAVRPNAAAPLKALKNSRRLIAALRLGDGIVTAWFSILEETMMSASGQQRRAEIAQWR
jgi:hypothetical protein